MTPEGDGLACLAADATRWGIVAFTVLKVPIVSMSMTALKALGESAEMGAMKLPAAPALLVALD